MYTGESPGVAMILNPYTVNIVDVGLLGYDVAQFNIDAIVSVAVGSVEFSPSGQKESAPPLAYCGNNGPIFNTCDDLVAGATVTVTVTPFPLPGQQGAPWPAVFTTIQIVDNRPIPSRSPSSPTARAQCGDAKVSPCTLSQRPSNFIHLTACFCSLVGGFLLEVRHQVPPYCC
jgi:hypothetical protein